MPLGGNPFPVCTKTCRAVEFFKNRLIFLLKFFKIEIN